MKNPLVVGYKGEIGSYILQGLLKELPKASNIWCVDVNDPAEAVAERISKADVIFLCVPLNETLKFLQVWECDLTGKIIVEQTSLKSVLYSDKKFRYAAENYYTVLSMHILFRPSGTPNYNDKAILFVGESQWRLHQELQYQIEHMLPAGFYGTYLNWALHDKEMAVQQTLVHRVLTVLDECLQTNKTGHTFISKQIMALAYRIRQMDPKLFAAIQSNKFSATTINKFNKKLKDFKV